MSSKRNDIILATLKLTIEKGFSGTSTDDIATEANVGKGTIYRYFESKDGLYSDIFDELRSKFISIVASNYKFELDPKSNFRSAIFIVVN